MPAEWVGADEAARRLGVKPATLYAYVSRGVLRRHHAPAGDADDRRHGRSGGRRSLFDAAEIDELARRGRPRRPPGPSELVIESRITALRDGRPYYRGHDVLELAAGRTFEEVAGLLWTGELPGSSGSETWRAVPAAVDAGRTAQAALPVTARPLERLQVVVAALAAADPLRFHLDPGAVVATGQSLIAGMVACLPAAGARAEHPAKPVAARLWDRLSPRSPRPGLLEALDAALVLLADHELAASTLAARVAASVRADPYAVVATGLGVLGGPLHGGASLAAAAMLAEAREPGDAVRVVGERLRRGERVAGLGHAVYRDGDRRADMLLNLIRAAAPGHPRLAVAEAVVAEAAHRRLPMPNIDFALATLGAVSGMIEGAGEAIFAVARTAGWLAHALEEYDRRFPLRPRAVYTGTPP